MFKRLSALLLALLLFTSAAAEEGMIASYVMPDGAEMRFLTEADAFAIPAGLESMYALMRSATLSGDVYLLRMRNGRVLASVSCTYVESPRTAQQLQELWPQIAQNLAAQAASVNDDPSCATVEERYGYQALCIRTELDVGDSAVIPLKASGFAFCRGDEMLEVWTVYPNENIYLYDEAAAAELESDLADLDVFLDSLDFSGRLAALGSAQDYADPAGRFSLQIPAAATVVTPETSPEDIAAVRERYLAANEAGAGRVFDEFMTDLEEQNATLILTEDMKGAIQIYCSREPDFQGVTTEMLCGIAPNIRESIEERYGTALLLTVEDGTWLLSGHRQAVMSYWVRAEEMDFQLDVLACVIGEDWLCEVDVYTADGEQALRDMLHLLVAQTLAYTVE